MVVQKAEWEEEMWGQEALGFLGRWADQKP